MSINYLTRVQAWPLASSSICATKYIEQQGMVLYQEPKNPGKVVWFSHTTPHSGIDTMPKRPSRSKQEALRALAHSEPLPLGVPLRKSNKISTAMPRTSKSMNRSSARLSSTTPRRKKKLKKPNKSVTKKISERDKPHYERDYRLTPILEEDFIHATEVRANELIVQFERKHKRAHSMSDLQEIMGQLDLDCDPHSGNNSVDDELLNKFSEVVSGLHSHSGFEQYLSLFEDLIFCCDQLRKANSIEEIFFPVMCFVKLRSGDGKSLTLKFKDVFVNLYKSMKEIDSIEPHSSANTFKFLHIWREKAQHPLFAKTSFLLSFLVTVGVLKSSCFSVKGFELFKLEALKTQSLTSDLVDGILGTLIFFVEKGYSCFAECSLDPLWRATDELEEFDNNFNFLQTHIHNVRTGNLIDFTGKDEAYFQEVLDDCRKRVRGYIATASNSTLRNIMMNKSVQLDKIYCDFHNYMAACGLREAPFCFCLFGKSSVGKTSLCNTLLTLMLGHNNFSNGDKDICTLQTEDKYWSTYKTNHTGLILDDMCNTKADKSDVNPTSRIIDIMNNCVVYAPKAVAEEKGKVYVRPKVVAITTNNGSLDAEFWSVEPVSILRRINVRIIVEVKPQYTRGDGKLNSDMILINYPDQNDLVKDVWSLTVQRLQPYTQAAENGAEGYKWINMVDNRGKEMVDVGIHDIIPFLLPMTEKHFAQQKKLVKDFSNIGHKIESCKECCNLKTKCICVKPEPHSSLAGFLVKTAITSTAATIDGWWRKTYNDFVECVFPTPREWSVITTMNELALYSHANRLYRSPYVWWTRWIPDSLVRCDEFHSFYYWISRRNIAKDLKIGWLFNTIKFCLLGSLTYAYLYSHVYFTKGDLSKFHYGYFTLFSVPISCITGYGVALKRSLEITQEELNNRRNKSDIYKSLGNIHADLGGMVKSVALLGAGFATLCLLRGIWRELVARNYSAEHSGLNPENEDEVVFNNTKFNPWKWISNPIPESNDNTLSRTPQQLRSTVDKNLVYISFSPVKEGPRRCTDGLFLKSNQLLLPKHIWYPDLDTTREPHFSLWCTFTRAENAKVGGNTFSERVYFTAGVQVGEEDLMIFHVPFGGTFRDLLPFIPTAAPTTSVGVLSSYRNVDGIIKHFYGQYTPLDASYVNSFSQKIKITGGKIDYSIPTFRGMCISPAIADMKGPYILGLHIAGLTGSVEGRCISIPRSTFERSIVQLRATPGFVDAHSEGKMDTVVLGKTIGFTPIINSKSPVQFISDFHANVYGSCDGAAKYRSCVEPSILAPLLESQYGIENVWAGPDFIRNGKLWEPWYDSLIHMVNPCHGIDPAALEYARKDYLLQLVPKLGLHSVRQFLRPLTEKEVVNGIPNCRFIDAMNFKSSIGFPHTGSKSNFVVDMHSLGDDGYPDRQFISELGISQAIMECKSRYLRGERCHHIFKACLKDEPTKVTKKKVRVFQAAPIVFQMLLREYFLPILKFLSTFPLDSECAVGINCYGPDYAELIEFLTSHGEDQILAGDYGKYDLRMPNQVIYTALDIYIRIARMSRNYTHDDLYIMQGLATDLANPCIAFNGTLLGLFGTMPSGHNATAHCNSTCNSLLLRVAFYTLVGPQPFRRYASIITYGDDLVGGVSPKVPEFNHITVANFFKTIDLEFTMPDKTSAPTLYMNIYDVDFLKRKTLKHCELNRHVGALQLESIHKSLCCYRKGNESKRCVAKSVIQSALFELVLHGREVFDQYRGMLLSITGQIELSVPDLRVSYDERIALWYVNYQPDVDVDTLPECIEMYFRKFKEERCSPVVGSLPDNVIEEFF